MRSFIIVFILLAPLFSFAQVKDSTKIGLLTGAVKDSSNQFPLQSVTITIYKKADSSIVDYQLSSPEGTFSFSTIPVVTPILVNFSFMGFRSVSKLVTIDSVSRKYDLKDVFLSRGYGSLEEVVVQAVVPIRMNGDTLEINPAAFKLDSNAVVEDMLRRVPGVTMWGDGTITVNGKKVNNVFVDGKPFFGGDPAIATQNLPKNAIEKIQVYQEKDYTKDEIDEKPTDSLLTMNIKLKEDKKKGFFGKVSAGIGTDHRYEADLSMQAYNKKNRFGLAAASNNINKSADQESIFQQSTYRNFNPSNRYVANFGGSGVTRIGYIGANYQHNFAEAENSRFNNQLTARYDLRQNINDVSSETNSRSTTDNGVLVSNSNRESHSSSFTNSFNTGYNKRDRIRDFSINGNFNTSTGDSWSKGTSVTDREGVGRESEGNNQSNSKNNSQNVSLNTRFSNRDDDERNLKSYSLNYNLNYGKGENENKSIDVFNSFTDPTRNRTRDRINNSNNDSFSNNLNFNYNSLKRLLFGNRNLWNINIGFVNDLNYSNSGYESNVKDYDTLTGTYRENKAITNDNRSKRLEEKPSLRFTKNFSKNLSDRFFRYIYLTANIQGQFINEKNISNFEYRNINRSFGFVLPSFNAGYNYRRFNKYNFNVNLSQSTYASTPTIDQLYPIIDTTNRTYFNYGNPFLDPSYTNNLNFNLNYNTENRQRKADWNFGLNASIGRTNNGIVDSTVYKGVERHVYLLNMDGRKFINAGLNVNTSIKLKKDMLQFGYNSNFSNNVSPNYIDTTFSTSRSQNINNSLRVFYSVGDIATFQISQGLNLNASKSTGGRLTSFFNRTYNTQASINLKYPKDFTLSNTITYVNNKSANKSAALWNAFLTYRFLKSKQAEVKFSAMDILKQNQNINVYSGLGSLTTTVTNGLQQFYMVTFSYYPRQFGGGKRRGAGNSTREYDGGNREYRQRNFDSRGSSGSGGGSGRRRN